MTKTLRALAALVLAVPITLYGQAVGGGGVPGAGGSVGSGFPITLGSSAIAASSTTTSVAGLTSLQNVKYLSAASDIGAQINTAVTALSGTGVIVLPNSTSIPMSTTATAIPPGISIRGYGKLASIIDCTVAGDCLQFQQNPTTAGEIGSVISDFGIIGSGASNQVLMHANGMSGYTLHDLQFEPYAGSGNAAVCLEFDNSANGLFVEGNRTYNVSLERQCTIGALFNQGTDSDTSFGYNIFEFHVVAQGSNYGIVFNGPGVLYAGLLTVYGNHVGPGGGMIQFNNGSTTGALLPSEELRITAEENGSGSGVLIDATGSGALNFTGWYMNGAGGAPSLATTIGGSNAGSVTFQEGVQSDNNGNYTFGNGASNTGPGGVTFKGTVPNVTGGIGFDIVAPTGGVWAGFQLDSTTLGAGNTIYQFVEQSHNFTLFNTTDNTEPLTTVTTPSTFKNLVKTNGLGQFCWEATSQYSNTSSVCDTGMSRTATNTIAFGNGTQANATANLAMGSVKPTVYTVSTLPSAATLGAGAMVSVSDGAGTPPACTGSGSNYQIAVSNGSTWTCH